MERLHCFANVIILFALLMEQSRAVLPNGWACGTDTVAEQFSEGIITADCPANKDAINGCCVAHDKCYEIRAGREMCDNVFCNCLTVATATNEKCRLVHGPSFCNLVRTFGEIAYQRG